MDVLDWITKAKNYNSDSFLNEFSIKMEKSNEVIQIQLDQWDKDGTDVKGRIIGLYKKSTEKLSNGRKKAGQPYDLRDSGDFWKNTFLKITRQGNDLLFEFDSSGKNKEELFQTIQFHGNISNPTDIFGLNNPYISQLIKEIEPIFINQLEKYYTDV